MENGNCQKRCKNSCIIEVILSAVLGTIIGVLFLLGLIPAALSFIVVALAVSIIGIATIVISLFTANLLKKNNNFEKCICMYSICLLIATIGTLISATIAASIITIPIISAIPVGLTAFFFIWTIIALIKLIICLIQQTCRECNE